MRIAQGKSGTLSMKQKNIIIRDIISLRGPNIWTFRPVLEAWVDIGELEDFPSNELPGLYERLTAWLPTLEEHRCSYGEHGGVLRRLQEGTWAGHILEHIAIELQNLAGLRGSFGKTRQTSERGVYKVAVRAWHEDITRAALHKGRDLIMAAIEDRLFNVAAAVEELVDMADSKCLGPSTASIVDAAAERGIPSIRLLADGNLVQLGYSATQRRIWTAETDRTSCIAENISCDKDLTKFLLSSSGVPVPEGRIVEGVEDAWQAAQDIGLPVCIKPLDGNHGRGVFVEIKTREEIEKAYAIAVNEGNGVLVERSIPGVEHRLLVVDGKMVAANRSELVWVTGDGISTVRELIDTQVNSDPRRGPSEMHVLATILVEDPATAMELDRQGLNSEAIPAINRPVLIQRDHNHAYDITDEIHPENAATAVLAAQVIGLDIAGIDLVCEDISKPLAEQGGAIVEVNAGPCLMMHLKPGIGKPRPVGLAIVNSLFAENESGRIPVVGITGTHGKTAVAKLVAHLVQLSGKQVGLACSDGLYLNRSRIQTSNAANWTGGHCLLVNQSVETAIIENGGRTILGEGLPYDRCQVGIVTNIEPNTENLSRWDVQPDGGDYFTNYTRTYRTQVDVVLHNGFSVLNASDEKVAQLAELSDGEVIFFAADPDSPVMAAHLTKGGRGVVARDGYITLATGSDEIRLCHLRNVPVTSKQGNPDAITTILAGVAAGWALGVAQDVISTGIRTFGIEMPAHEAPSWIPALG